MAVTHNTTMEETTIDASYQESWNEIAEKLKAGESVDAILHQMPNIKLLDIAEAMEFSNDHKN